MKSTGFALVLATFAGLAAGVAHATDNKSENSDQRSRMRFERLDRDRSGGLSFQEFSAMLRMRVEDADANRDGKIVAEELAAAFEQMRGRGMADRLMQRFDVNGDGVLTSDEIETRQKRMFARLDRNGDGSLEFSEMPKRQDMRGAGGPGQGKGGPGRGQGMDDGFGIGPGGGVPGLDPDDGQQ